MSFIFSLKLLGEEHKEHFFDAFGEHKVTYSFVQDTDMEIPQAHNAGKKEDYGPIRDIFITEGNKIELHHDPKMTSNMHHPASTTIIDVTDPYAAIAIVFALRYHMQLGRWQT